MMYLDKDKPCLETNKELAQRFGVVESQINNLLVDLKSKDLDHSRKTILISSPTHG